MLLGTPLAIAGILVVAIVARFVLHRVIDKITDGILSGRTGIGRLEERLPSALVVTSPMASARREQRGRTLASVLKSVTTATIGAIAALMILEQLGVNTGPLLASAGIVGIAVGFGAQALVRDVISGLFMLVEDQYGVGDVVDLGDASGVVEAVGLRVTRVRDVDGTVWYIRNGEVLRVGNRSQGWARAVLDVGIAYGEDVTRAEALLLEVAQGLVPTRSSGPWCSRSRRCGASSRSRRTASCCGSSSRPNPSSSRPSRASCAAASRSGSTPRGCTSPTRSRRSG